MERHHGGRQHGERHHGERHHGERRAHDGKLGERGGSGGGGGGGGGGGDKRKASNNKVMVDLSRHADKNVLVRLAGGRNVRGVLKGWDTLLNLVLDDAVELLRDAGDSYRLSGKERRLGRLVARGTSVMTISPVDGVEQIDNPFVAGAGGGDD